MANSVRLKRGKNRKPSRGSRPHGRFSALLGTRNSGATTDQIMNSLRGYSDDADDPGFKGLNASVARLPRVKHARATRYKRQGRA
jgi:hypothetical protein